MSGDYALRLADSELRRYQLMADVARAAEQGLWTSAGVASGARVLDLGCGPGAVLLAMAQVVGPHGSVLGIDADADALAAARTLLETAGVTQASVQFGSIMQVLPALAADVAVLRHVLAHNGPTEQALVDHAASLVRPGGCVYLVDIDATLFRFRAPAAVAELWTAYRTFQTARGNDLAVGLRLTEILTRAGLEPVVDEMVATAISPDPGWRPPPWAARQAMLAAGVIEDTDLARWEAQFTGLDAASVRPRLYMPYFVAVGRRPSCQARPVRSD